MDHEDISAITEYITKGVYPRGISKGEKRSMRKRCQSFVLKNGILYHQGNKHKKQRQVVSDPQERTRILDAMHRDSEGRPAHNGIKFTHRKVTDFYWWRGITEDVKSFCKRCSECAQAALAAQLAGSNPKHSEPEDSDSNMREVDVVVAPLCIVPIVEHRELTSTSHSSDLVASLRRLFEEKVGFDVVLSAGGFQVPAHKVVVMATSDYLKSMITDQDQATKDHSMIQLADISGLCLEPIVSFLYTGTLRLSLENVHLISAAAAQLGITSAVALCQRFLDNDIAPPVVNDEKLTSIDVDVKNDSCEPESKVAVAAAYPFFRGAPEASDSGGPDDFTILDIKEEVLAVPSVNLEEFVASVSAPTPRTTRVKKPPNLPDCFVSLSRNTCAPPHVRANNQPARADWRRTGSIRYTTRSAIVQKIVPRPRASRSDELRRRALQKSRRAAMVKSLLDKHGRRYACYVCESVFEFASGLQHHQRIRHGILRLDLALHRLAQMTVRAAVRSVLLRMRKPHGETVSRLSRKMVGKQVSKRISSRLDKSHGKMSDSTPGREVRRKKTLLNAESNVSDATSKNQDATDKKPDATSQNQDATNKKPDATSKKPDATNKTSMVLTGSIFRMWSKAVRYECRKHVSARDFKSKTPLPIYRNRCGWCGRTFLRRADLLEHRKVFHQSRKKPAGSEPVKRRPNDWSCRERGCDARPKRKEELKEHMAAAHPNVFLSCPLCRFKTQVDYYLKRHLVKRHRERHTCPICSRSYHKLCLLRVHLYNQHKVEDPSLKLERCPHEGCGYACPGKWALKAHMLKHSIAKPFTCDKCGRDFKRALSLEKHINKIHLGIRGYICDKCGGSFADESELRRHAIRHDKNKTFVCAKCPFQSYIKAAFQSHMYSRHQVIVNDRMHLFKCDQCEFATDRRHRFTEHVKKHANVRDIPCPECGKLFVTNKTMRQHIVKVHKQTTLYCTFCPFRTLSQAKLQEHVSLMHDLPSEVDAAGSSVPDGAGPSTLHPSVGPLSHSNAGSSSHRTPAGTGSHRNATRASSHSKGASASHRADVDTKPPPLIVPPPVNPNSAQLPYSDVGATMYTEAGPSSLSVVRPLFVVNQCPGGFPTMMPGCEATSIPMSIENTFCRFNTFNGGSSVR